MQRIHLYRAQSKYCPSRCLNSFLFWNRQLLKVLKGTKLILIYNGDHFDHLWSIWYLSNPSEDFYSTSKKLFEHCSVIWLDSSTFSGVWRKRSIICLKYRTPDRLINYFWTFLVQKRHVCSWLEFNDGDWKRLKVQVVQEGLVAAAVSCKPVQ